MKQNSLLIAGFLMVVSIMAISCAKEGPVGPAGAQGAQGSAGPAGATGPAGPAGSSGASAIVYSAWLDVPFAQDTSRGGWFGEIVAAKLDSVMLATGEIKVYANAGSPADPVVISLPYNNGTDVILPIFVKGGVILSATNDFGTYTQAGTKRWQYRYLLIPGGTKAQNGLKVDWNDYKQVQAALGIFN